VPTPRHVWHRRGAAVLTAALLAGTAAAQQARLYDEPEDLPEGEGRETTFYQCSACHGFNLVARQGMSRAMWDDTLNLMVERHGMYALEPRRAGGGPVLSGAGLSAARDAGRLGQSLREPLTPCPSAPAPAYLYGRGASGTEGA
jgi:mono/diheme cytochrome c family protein